MKVLIEIGKVPLGSKVTKKTGDKLYEVCDKIQIYAESGLKIPINSVPALEGTRIMRSVDPNYSFAITVVPDSLEVMWVVSDDELRDYLDDIESHQ